MKDNKKPILEVKNLQTHFKTDAGVVKAVNGVSFTVDKGETVGIVGESGCGKSVTNLSIMKLIPSPPGKIVGGEVIFDGQNILNLPESELRTIRGNKISMIFQDPMTSLNPFLRISTQMIETIRLHEKNVSKAEARARSIEMLQKVGIPAAEARIDSYPHQFSGGMRQRVMIAMALSCNAQVLIADEPTTALDVTIQAQILNLIKGMSKKLNTAVLFISHDLALVKNLCDRVYVMYASMIVETSSVDNIITDAKHPYTKALLKSLPTIKQRGTKLHSINGIVPKLENRVENACPFAPRCEFARQLCFDQKPCLEKVGDSYIRCHFHKEINQ